MAMKISVVLLCIALLIIPSLSQPTFVGGTYGTSWLAANGNRNVVPNATVAPNATVVPNATGLWSWGGIPLGNILLNGKLVSTGGSGNSELIYPAFVTNPTPLIGNASLNAPQYGPRGLTLAQLSSSYLYEDPWALAQSTGQPILIQNPPYY
jgi:hypothetical protein